MEKGFRVPGVKPRITQLISDRDRDLAIHQLTEFHERGFLDEIELEHRVEHVKLAQAAHEIEPWLVDLRGGGRGRGELRASEDDRAAAVRRLDLHREAGQLTDVEHERRVALVSRAGTPAEIGQALTELPPLRPQRKRPSERLAPDSERGSAVGRLNRALAEGRLTIDEHRRRVDIARSARTRNEIKAAFHGLDVVNLQKHVTAAGKIGTGVATGGKRILGGVIVFAWAVISALVVIVWLLTGMAPGVPVVILALTALTAALLLSVPRIVRGGRPRG
jgi:hypothetical protein